MVICAIASNRIYEKDTPFLISRKLSNQATFNGYRLRAVAGLSEMSYLLHYHKALGDKSSKKDQADMIDELIDFNKLRKSPANSGVIELSTADNTQFAGYLAFENSVRESPALEISALAVPVCFQRNGIGSYLLDCVINIARQSNAKRMYLEAEHGAVSFYIKHGMTIIKNRNMELDISERKISTADVPPYLDLALTDRQQLRPVPNLLFDLA